METLSRNDYFQVGLDLLAEGGIASVTIANVCARLGVTKGSFYHHFRGGPEFQRQLLGHWEHEYGRVRVAAIDESSSPEERLALQLKAVLDRNHEAESAIRAWSRTDPVAARVQRRLDTLRVDYTAATLEACGLPRGRALALSRLGLAALVGFQSLNQPVDRKALREALDEFSRWIDTAIAEERHEGRSRRRRSGPAA